MSSSANIIIGCGGSGIETIKRFNRLLAEDPYWHDHAYQDIYYIAVDTEAAQIDSLEDEIQTSFGGVRGPYVCAIQTSAEWNNLGAAVDRFMVSPYADGADSEKLERLKEHWWFDQDDAPFDAPLVTPLSDGAGQCPPVSYFLTWLKMTQIEGRLTKLINLIKTRRAQIPGCSPLENNNVIIASSLAGGTGRGCWQLLAFKFRQICKRMGARNFANPVAYLYQGSLYAPHVNSDQSLSVRVNSFTGVSELSSWLSMISAGVQDKVEYDLPNMQYPDRNVLDVGFRENKLSVTPVNNVYLIFPEGSDQTVIGEIGDAYDMVGTAIYSKVTESAIKAEFINDSDKPYWGVGTATFEIPADSIRTYIELSSRVKATEQLLAIDEATAGTAVGQLLHELNLSFSEDDYQLPLRDAGLAQSAAKPDGQGNLLQRIRHFLVEKAYADDLHALDEALEIDDVQRALELTKSIEQSRKSNDKVKRAVTAAIESIEEETDSSILDHVTGNLYHFEGQEEGTLLNRSYSIATVKRALEMFTERFLAQLRGLPEQLQGGASIAPFKEVQGAAGSRAYVLFGRRIDEEEKKQIVAEAKVYLQRASYQQVCKQLQEVVAEWQQALTPKISACQKLCEAGSVVRADLQVALIDSGLNEANLFADYAHPEESLPKEYSGQRFQTRRLLPVKPDVVHSLEFGAMESFLIATVDSPPESHSTYASGSGGLSDLLRDQVMMHVTVPGEFMAQFEFENAITRLRAAWLGRFDRCKNNLEEMKELSLKFSSFFGLEPEIHPVLKTVQLEKNTETFVWAMAASLVETCRPYWQLKTEPTEGVKVFLPVPVRANQQTEVADYVNKHTSRELVPTIYSLASSLGASGRCNPYIMIAYSSTGTRTIESILPLNEWQEDPAVEDLLARCEDESGESILSQAAGKGIGYCDPIYVRNEIVRRHRWRPWAARGQAVVAAAENELLDTIIYALLDPPESIKEELAAAGWEAPLLREERGERFVFQRPKYRCLHDSITLDNRHWAPGKSICRSVCNLYSQLLGPQNEILKQMKDEAATFRGLAEKLEFNQGRRYEAMMLAFQESLAKRLHKADHDDLPIWRKLDARVDELIAQA
jgi:hypothetical protein